MNTNSGVLMLISIICCSSTGISGSFCPQNPYMKGDFFEYSVGSFRVHRSSSGAYIDWACKGSQKVQILNSSPNSILFNRFDSVECTPTGAGSEGRPLVVEKKESIDSVVWKACDSSFTQYAFNDFPGLMPGTISSSASSMNGISDTQYTFTVGPMRMIFSLNFGQIFSIRPYAGIGPCPMYGCRDTLTLRSINGFPASTKDRHSSLYHRPLKQIYSRIELSTFLIKEIEVNPNSQYTASSLNGRTARISIDGANSASYLSKGIYYILKVDDQKSEVVAQFSDLNGR